MNGKCLKSDWAINNIRIEKISRFLEYHFEFESKSFNNFMPKDGSSEVIGGRSSR